MDNINASRLLRALGLLTSIILLGCSTNPSIQQGASIQEFASSLNGKRFSFEMTGSVWVPSMSGVLVTAQRLPKGLLLAMEPAREHCARQGGEIVMAKLQAVELHPKFHPQLPLRAVCERRGEPLWALDGPDWTAGAIPVFGKKLIDMMRTAALGDEIDRAAIDVAMAAWLFDSAYGGLNEEAFIQCDLEFTMLQDGTVKYDRRPGSA